MNLYFTTESELFRDVLRKGHAKCCSSSRPVVFPRRVCEVEEAPFSVILEGKAEESRNKRLIIVIIILFIQ